MSFHSSAGPIGGANSPIVRAGTPVQSQPPQQTQKEEQKPSLTGVRIKQRKRQVQASAKFEPESMWPYRHHRKQSLDQLTIELFFHLPFYLTAFRDALLVHLNSLPLAPTVDQIVAKLVLAGSSLELLKYAEQFFEIYFTGGLLQPGGSYLDAAEEKRTKICVFACNGAGIGVTPEGSSENENEVPKGDQWKKEIKDLVEALKKMIQRYKYMQKPLDEIALPGLLAYLPRWPSAYREKMAYATAYFILENQITGRCLQTLLRDVVVKDDVSINFITTFFKAFLAAQTIEQLGSLLRKSGINDLLAFFPNTKRDRQHLEKHFKSHGLNSVVDYHTKKVNAAVKEEVVARLREMMSEEDSTEDMLEYLKTKQAETKVSESDMITAIWHAIMENMDWNAKPEHLDAMAVKCATTYAGLLEPFCNGAKAEVGLLNTVQVYCYSETRVMKAFPQLVKVLYNTDCLSDQAIIYWASKGAAPQGKQHFLKVTEPLVK
ncbi:hypothetical protein QFC19_007967 [Naganishia cerealis]|uniref:Uncharacterized protein n=1 Tax=Naganishia cerealis TaxID=610337 RepID=A0ACC2V4V3_9TREE|nr:hypothetical protein QFC19_007967 [Naganishia cerealis]